MSAEEDKYLVVGEILKPWGYKGEVKVQILTDFPKRLPKFKTVFLGEQARAVQVERARLHSGAALFKFQGIDTPEHAATLRGQIVRIPMDEATPLKKGQYYQHQIIGLRVVTEQSQELGMVADILETGANDVYVVRTPDGKEILLPAIHDVIRDIDLENKRLTVRIMPGLLQ